MGCSFSSLCNFPLYKYTMIYLSVMLVNIGIISSWSVKNIALSDLCQFILSISSEESSCCSTSSTCGIVSLSYFSHSVTMKRFLIMILMCISLMTKTLSDFSYAYWPFLYLFCDVFISLFCPFLIDCLDYWFIRILYSQIGALQIFPPSLWTVLFS